MKTIFRLPLYLFILLSLLVLSGCTAIPNLEDGLVIGNNYRLGSGQTLNHDLTVIGGNAVLEQDSRVNGDVAIMGGTVTIDGEVTGDVSVMGGSVRLDDNAIVRGTLNQIGGSIDQASGAQVERSSTPNNPPFRSTMQAPNVSVNFDPIIQPMLAFFRALALAALAILVMMFAPTPMNRVGQAALTQPLATGGIGLLTLPVGIITLALMVITIILIPVTLLGFLALGLALVFGWLAMGLVTGRQMARMFNQTWSDPINAGVGALALSLVASLANLIWCVGWLPTVLISAVGLGAVIVTRFGTQDYIVAAPPAYPPQGSYGNPYMTPSTVPPVGPVSNQPMGGAPSYPAAPNLSQDNFAEDLPSPEEPENPPDSDHPQA